MFTENKFVSHDFKNICKKNTARGLDFGHMIRQEHTREV
jgi:hypothetical protein